MKTYKVDKNSEYVKEDWNPVHEYESLYEVSSLGNIKGIKRNKILSKSKDRRGYEKVGLFKNGLGKTFKIHALVSRAFIGKRPLKYEVNHKNGVKSDNRIENLEYCTPSYNQKHAYKIGLKTLTGVCQNNA